MSEFIHRHPNVVLLAGVAWLVIVIFWPEIKPRLLRLSKWFKTVRTEVVMGDTMTLPLQRILVDGNVWEIQSRLPEDVDYGKMVDQIRSEVQWIQRRGGAMRGVRLKLRFSRVRRVVYERAFDPSISVTDWYAVLMLVDIFP